VVQAILNKLQARDNFTRAAYEGFYSTKRKLFNGEGSSSGREFDPGYGESSSEREHYLLQTEEHQTWLIDTSKAIRSSSSRPIAE